MYTPPPPNKKKGKGKEKKEPAHQCIHALASFSLKNSLQLAPHDTVLMMRITPSVLATEVLLGP